MNNKISIITTFFPPENGAASQRILNTAKELSNSGFDVNVISTLPNYPTGKIFSDYRWRFFKKEKIEGITTLRLWVLPSNSNNIIIRLISMMSFCISLFFIIPFLIFSRPNLLFIQSPPLFVAFTALFISKIIKIKSVVNISDIWPLTASELGVMSKKNISFRLLSYLEKKMYVGADELIVQSEESMTYINKFTDKKVLLYRNLTKPSKNIIFKENNENRVRFIYAGLLGLAQGILDICKNVDFKKLDVEFHIYGDGVERSKIKSYIKDKNLNIILHKAVSKEKIQQILPAFDAVIISLKNNIFGAFPSKIYMAINSGIPILYSGGGDGYNTVKKYKLGYVSAPSDYKELNNNILKFIKLDSSSKLQIRNNVIFASKTYFNYEKQQIELIKFIKEITNYEK